MGAHWLLIVVTFLLLQACVLMAVRPGGAVSMSQPLPIPAILACTAIHAAQKPAAKLKP